MIFFFGTRETHLRTVPTPGYACPACATNGSLSLRFFSRYAHLFFVPLFGTSRRTVLFCSHCQFEGAENTIPASLQPTAQQLKKQISRPWWQFSGLLLLGLLVLAVAVTVATSKPKAEKDKEELGRLHEPHKNDVIVVNADSSSDNVGLLRVNRVGPDSVYVSPSKIAEGSFKAYQHSRKPDSYQDTSYPIAISELEAMHKAGRVRDVLRD